MLVRAQQVTPSVQRYRVGSTQTINGNTGLYYFNPNDFTVPAQWTSPTYIPTPDQRTYGVPRNSIPGVGLVNLDLAIGKKNVFFHEKLTSEIRVEAFNALNHAEFANPNTDITNPAFFGQITQTVTQTGRVGQIALRITF